MNALLSAIVVWLSINFGLTANHDYPRIQRLPAGELSQVLYGRSDLHDGRQVIALYDDAHKTIFLSDSWSGRTPAELSVLVHEMVHHLQNMNGLTYACPAAREELAYSAQEAWLGLFGSSLQAAFELDPMTLKLTTACLPY